MSYEYTFILNRKSKNASLKKGNQMISSNDRFHPIVKSQITKYLRELGETTALDAGIKERFSPNNPCTVTITVYAPTKRRMDAPNWYPTVKALLDGITDAGLWTDDNNDVIKVVSFKYGGLSGDKQYRLKIEIEVYNG